MMAGFRYFVVLADMRTGSNLLETQLNALSGVACHAELFNPQFIGQPGVFDLAGVTLADRMRDPFALLAAVQPGGALSDGVLAGFRLFHDHDPRMRAHVLADPACAKIVLTRNPLESHVSLKIAEATDQWKMGDVRDHRRAQVPFDADDFDAYLHRLQAALLDIQRMLQTTGQTAFHIHYEDIADPAVINGLAQWLGVPGRLSDTVLYLKKQNPGAIEDKLTNPGDLAPGLARIDRFDLSRVPGLEPRRGPMLPVLMAGARTPLLAMPLRGSPEEGLAEWLRALDGADPVRGFDRGRLRDWRQANPARRSFTVLRDPLLRAHRAFCDRVLSGAFANVREHMSRLFGVTLPDGPVDLPLAEHRAAFKAYLRFVAASLDAQSMLRPWPVWASQAALLDGFGQIGGVDHVLREDTLSDELSWLAGRFGHPAPPPAPVIDQYSPLSLDQVADDEVRSLCRAAYARDYETFGFADPRLS